MQVLLTCKGSANDVRQAANTSRHQSCHVTWNGHLMTSLPMTSRRWRHTATPVHCGTLPTM